MIKTMCSMLSMSWIQCLMHSIMPSILHRRQVTTYSFLLEKLQETLVDQHGHKMTITRLCLLLAVHTEMIPSPLMMKDILKIMFLTGIVIKMLPMHSRLTLIWLHMRQSRQWMICLSLLHSRSKVVLSTAQMMLRISLMPWSMISTTTVMRKHGMLQVYMSKLRIIHWSILKMTGKQLSLSWNLLGTLQLSL